MPDDTIESSSVSSALTAAGSNRTMIESPANRVIIERVLSRSVVGRRMFGSDCGDKGAYPNDVLFSDAYLGRGAELSRIVTPSSTRECVQFRQMS